MQLNTLDIVTFVGFLVFVIGVSIYASRKEESSEDYFLAGRGLSWWVIGLSLIASNISTEHFIGMAGEGFSSVGLAIASYEWIAALTLIVVALYLLPRFLKAGVYTIPQYLEMRYNSTARTLMSFLMLVIYVLVTMATVLMAGAKALNVFFDISMGTGVWILGITAGIYTVYGGLKAVVWSDVIQGTTLMIGGAIVLYLGIDAIGGVNEFMNVAGDRLHTVLPADNPSLPWPAIFLGPMLIPNIYYWGLNQFITQRTLGAKSLDEGQKGVLFGASLKLIIPFLVVFPGIIAFHLYGDQIVDKDQAYAILLKELLPTGIVGLLLAALFGATMSTMDSLLNSASTIFTIDIYQPYFKKEMSQKQTITVGRASTLVFMVIACLWAPILDSFDEGLYEFIQKFSGFIQPGIVAAFFFGFLWKRVPSEAAVGAILLNVPIYGALLHFFPEVAFLYHMGITFAIICAFVVVVTIAKPNTKEIKIPVLAAFDHKTSSTVKVWSALVAVATVALYIFFF